jgi:hypothetical protein
VTVRLLALAPALVLLLPGAGTAQVYPWQRLDAAGDDTGLIRAMSVRVALDGDAVTATIDEDHFGGARVSLTMSARLGDLNLDAAQARESMRSIHPHVGVVVFRCRGGARCVTYSAPGDTFFEFPGPTQFGFFVADPATAEQAVADLRRIAQGGGR